MTEQLLSVTRAAELLRCTRQNVHFMIKDGKIEAENLGTYYVIRRAALEAYVRQQAQLLRTKAQELESALAAN